MMKNITAKINEALNESPAKDMKLSDEELNNDLKILDYPTGKEKKELAAKYNCDAKIKDLEYAVYTQFRFNRFRKKTFTDEDVTHFFRLHDDPLIYKKAVEIYTQEPTDFIVYLKDYRYKQLEKRKLTEKAKYGRAKMGYGLSYSDADLINHYINVEQYLHDSKPSEVAAKKEKENFINIIVAKLTEQTKDFKEFYVKRNIEWGTEKYKNAQETVGELHETYKKAWNEFDSHSKDWSTRKDDRKVWDDKYKRLNKIQENAYKAYRKVNALLTRYKTLKAFLDDCEKEAIEVFEHNIVALAQRINEKELNAAELKVNEIKDDPKFFSLLITDGEKNLYARSIVAARWSAKMRPHLRFIITSRKESRTDDNE